MRVLFCNDGPIRMTEDERYFAGALNDEYFSKYAILGKNITIATRVIGCTAEDEKKFTQLLSDKYTIVSVPNISNLKGIFFKKDAKKVLAEAIDNSDVIVVRVPGNISALAAQIAKAKKKVIIADVVGCAWDSLFNHSLKGKLVAVPSLLKEKKNVKNADYAIYVTEKFLQRRYPTKGKSYGVSDAVAPMPSPQVIEARLNHEIGNVMRIGTAAAVNIKYKGQHNVIKALGVLKKEGISNIQYVMVGSGDPTYLKQMAKLYDVEDQVIFHGSIPHNQIFSWLDGLDVYIQPSYQEGLSRSIVEALSRGLPCITSNAGGNVELASEEWVYKNDMFASKAIANLLKKIMQTPNYKELSQGSFATSKRYSLEVFKKRRLVYEEIAKEISNRIGI